MDADPASAGRRQDGLSWSWEVDLEALVAAVSDPADQRCADGAAVDMDADLAEHLEAVEAGRSRMLPLEMPGGWRPSLDPRPESDRSAARSAAQRH